MNLATGSKIGGFSVIRLIGEGGMSDVYLVQDNLDRQFALKTLSANLSRDSSFRERFKQEAKIMSALHHPHIVQLHSYFEEDDRFCLVMEYVEGGSLKDLIKEIGPIPEERALRYFSQVAEALSYAHGKGVIHRDIKPSNIMIGKDDEVKVMDFGIARMTESPGLTRTGTQMGTLVYMSPEQIRDSKHIDSKSDVYSLGVTLYELLTGRSPYDETTDSDFNIRENIVYKELPDPTLSYPHISGSTLQLFRSMTQKDKVNRPNTSQLLVAADEQSPGLPDDISPSASKPASFETSVQPDLPYPKKSKHNYAIGWIIGMIIVVVVVMLSLPKRKMEVPVVDEAAFVAIADTENTAQAEVVVAPDATTYYYDLPQVTISDDGLQIIVAPERGTEPDGNFILQQIIAHTDDIKALFIAHSGSYEEMPYGTMRIILNINDAGRAITSVELINDESNYSYSFINGLISMINDWEFRVRESTNFVLQVQAGWG